MAFRSNLGQNSGVNIDGNASAIGTEARGSTHRPNAWERGGLRLADADAGNDTAQSERFNQRSEEQDDTNRNGPPNPRNNAAARNAPGRNDGSQVAGVRFPSAQKISEVAPLKRPSPRKTDREPQGKETDFTEVRSGSHLPEKTVSNSPKRISSLVQQNPFRVLANAFTTDEEQESPKSKENFTVLRTELSRRHISLARIPSREPQMEKSVAAVNSPTSVTPTADGSEDAEAEVEQQHWNPSPQAAEEFQHRARAFLKALQESAERDAMRSEDVTKASPAVHAGEQSDDDTIGERVGEPNELGVSNEMTRAQTANFEHQSSASSELGTKDAAKLHPPNKVTSNLDPPDRQRTRRRSYTARAPEKEGLSPKGNSDGQEGLLGNITIGDSQGKASSSQLWSTAANQEGLYTVAENDGLLQRLLENVKGEHSLQPQSPTRSNFLEEDLDLSTVGGAKSKLKGQKGRSPEAIDDTLGRGNFPKKRILSEEQYKKLQMRLLFSQEVLQGSHRPTQPSSVRITEIEEEVPIWEPGGGKQSATLYLMDKAWSGEEAAADVKARSEQTEEDGRTLQ
ncbi:hypothetical protein R1sor_026705 [Riccia sorocarpa]|uniref:Uncharacterized protein n=1 Tax=Riccia sorocarpa TaxID=122646 RepID=A0ABD3GC38_9MARC